MITEDNKLSSVWLINRKTTNGLAFIKTMIRPNGNGPARYHHLRAVEVLESLQTNTALRETHGWRFSSGSPTSLVYSGSSDISCKFLLVHSLWSGYKLTLWLLSSTFSLEEISCNGFLAHGEDPLLDLSFSLLVYSQLSFQFSTGLPFLSSDGGLLLTTMIMIIPYSLEDQPFIRSNFF